MNIDIDKKICSGLLEYCNKNNVDFIKIVEESIVQNQLRHNINQEGNIYVDESYEIPDKIILEGLLKNIFNDIDGSIKEELLGKIYENIQIKDYKYLIGEYKGAYKIVVITDNKNRIEQIKKCKEIENLKIEESQALSWLATYKTKVIYKEREDCKILLLKKI